MKRENNKKTKKENIKKETQKERNIIFKINTRIIITIIMLLIVIASGTFAWFTYTSKKTSLVLTIGDIDNTQITLYPYQYTGTLNPVASYEDPSIQYIQVTATNKSKLSTSFALTYNAESIDEELRSQYVKYTITKSSSKDTGYVFYADGNLSGLTPDSPIVLLEKEKMATNTISYYRIYLWIDNSTGNHSTLQGKTLTISLNAKLHGVDTSGVPDTEYTIVNLSNNNSNTLGSGLYELTSYTCQNGSTVSYDKTTRRITTNGVDKCTLRFTETTGDRLYDVVEQGDYIAYTGNNGCTGNQCIGWNEGQTGTEVNEQYSYCHNPKWRYHTYGWRVLYKDSNSVYIISAGAPECVAGKAGSPTNNKKNLNEVALKYCNNKYSAGGECTINTTRSINGEDFYKFTTQYYGSANARYLYNYNDGGVFDETGTKICYTGEKQTYCGYNNDIIDNGSYYWFASAHSEINTLFWNPSVREVGYNGSADIFGVRPVIKLDASVLATGGEGTMKNPYTISTRTGV